MLQLEEVLELLQICEEKQVYSLCATVRVCSGLQRSVVDCRASVADCSVSVADRRGSVADCRASVADCRVCVADCSVRCRLQSVCYRLQRVCSGFQSVFCGLQRASVSYKTGDRPIFKTVRLGKLLKLSIRAINLYTMSYMLEIFPQASPR